MPGIKFTVVDHRQRAEARLLRPPAGLCAAAPQPRREVSARGAGGRLPLRARALVGIDRFEAESLELETTLHDVHGALLERRVEAVAVEPDSDRSLPLELVLPSAEGRYLLRFSARRADGSQACAANGGLNVVEPVFNPPVRVLLLGQSRYNEPISRPSLTSRASSSRLSTRRPASRRTPPGASGSRTVPR